MSDSTQSGDASLSLEPGAVRDAAGQLHKIRADLDKGYKTVSRAVEDVAGVSWTGMASSGFQSDFRDYQKAAQRILADAEEIESLLVSSVNQLVHQDKSSSTSIKSAAPTTLLNLDS